MRRPVPGNPATKKGTDPSDWEVIPGLEPGLI
jgi:hypothetical protein